MVENTDTTALFTEISQTLAESITDILRQQAVADFFVANEVVCPHCTKPIDGTQLIEDRQRHVGGKSASNLQDESIDAEDLKEAKDLLAKVESWSEEEIRQLPPHLRKKVREYRGRNG